MLALLWLEQRAGETPPMSLPALLDGVALPSDVADAVDPGLRAAAEALFHASVFGLAAPTAP